MMTNVLNETVYLREWFKKYHNEESAFLYYMNTDTIGYMIPELEEVYGKNKSVDMILSIDQQKINEKLPDVPPSGFNIDKDGTIKFVFNFMGSIRVQNNETLVWDDVRSLFATFQARLKLKVNTTFNETLQKNVFSIQADFKGLEMAMFKIFKNMNLSIEEEEVLRPDDDNEEGEEEDDEEQDNAAFHEGAKLEAMLIQSAINMKLDEIKKKLGSVDIDASLGDEDFNRSFYTCFGVALGVPKLDFFKHYLRLSQTFNYT